MLNQLVIVGRLVSDINIDEKEGKKSASITIAVQRSYKNTNGEYDVDMIDVRLWDPIIPNFKDCCHKGDVIGVKGRLETINDEQESKLVVLAEKVTFLKAD